FNFTMNQFDARQRYVEDVVAPPTEFAVRRRYVEFVVGPPTVRCLQVHLTVSGAEVPSHQS
ncbi:hypothetical protein, partial [Pseudomonas viridiflava]|uniref:hypothetical protein n=1 Tax=Pseudomonas viridiflava TaxID=33069 RepID=UPI002EA14041|nr:hypothetical protein [Pseudomonas viridiflava]